MADPTPQTFRLAIGQAKTLVVTMSPSQSIAAMSGRFRLRLPGGGLIEKTQGSGVTQTDPTNGVWEIELDPADSVSLPAGLYRWAFWDVTTGEENPIAYGTCEVYLTAETR